MGNTIPPGKTLWMAHNSSFSISLEFGQRAIISHGDPPAELEPEPSGKPFVFYVDKVKYDGWCQRICQKIRDEYHEKLEEDLNEAAARLRNFAEPTHPNLHVPIFGVLPYDTAIKLATVKWAFPPEETFKGEPMLLSVWATRSEERREDTQSEDAPAGFVYALHPLNLSKLPDSYIEDQKSGPLKEWMEFVKIYHDELKPILDHDRSNAVFSFAVRNLMPG
jgi:hypothetical protein